VQPAKGAAVKNGCSVTSQYRVLVAEDDDEMRALQAWWLRVDGYEVIECEHGIDLLNRICPVCPPLKPEKFDLIVSDIRMFGYTGLDVLEEMQRCETEFPPMILITAFGDKKIHQQARILGAATMFDKLFDLNELMARIHELVLPRPLSGIEVEGTLGEPASCADAHRPESERLGEQERK